MNAPTPSTERLAASPTDSLARPPTLTSVPPDARKAANDDYPWLDDANDHSVNPLWMITVPLGALIVLMGLTLATG